MMSHSHRSRRSLVPRLEAVEDRTYLSGFAHPRLAAVRAMVTQIRTQAITTDPAGTAAILSALRGGAGSEFVQLIRREVPNLNAVIRSFIVGKRTHFNAPGVAVKLPNFQELYNGPKYDHLGATVAGAILLKNRQLELAGIVRGPFDEAVPGYVVFGLDRGAGGSIGPRFASRPGIQPDLIVTIQVNPFGRSASGTITDLTTGITTNIDSSRIRVEGATVRVFLDPGQIPSKRLPIAKYRFAMWTQNTLGGIESVASFVPESTMIRIGRQAGRR